MDDHLWPRRIEQAVDILFLAKIVFCASRHKHVPAVLLAQLLNHEAPEESCASRNDHALVRPEGHAPHSLNTIPSAIFLHWDARPVTACTAFVTEFRH